MMMVDTINPNTDQPDDFLNTTQQPEQPLEPVVPTEPIQENSSEAPIDSANDHFFGGFDRPDEMKINLAGTPGEGSDAVSTQGNEQIIPPQAAPEAAPFNDLAPTEVETNPFENQIHSSYNKSQNPQKMPFVIAAMGVVAILLISSVTYFFVNNSNNSKLKTQQDQLDNLTASLRSFQETPEALQIPATGEETTTETPVVAPVTPTETQVTAPSTNVSPKSEDNKALGTG